MDSRRILLTTVGGLTSPDIIRALHENGERDIEVYGVDPFENAVGRYFCDHFESVPSSTSDPEAFATAIDFCARKNHIDAIIPCGNEDNLALALHRDRLPCPVMVAGHDDLALAYDKGQVYEMLQTHLPETAPDFRMVSSCKDFMQAIDALGFPDRRVVVKPREGRGGRGVYILNDRISFDQAFGQKPTAEFPLAWFEKLLRSKDRFDDLIVMEYLDEPYYSLYSLCDESETLITLTHTRDWGNASQTFRGRVYHDPDLQHLAGQINGLFNCRYTTNMELATSHDGRLVLFDLNPRIGASSGIDHEIGLNFPYQALKLLLDEPVSVNPDAHATPQCFIRYFDNVWSHG